MFGKFIKYAYFCVVHKRKILSNNIINYEK